MNMVITSITTVKIALAAHQAEILLVAIPQDIPETSLTTPIPTSTLNVRFGLSDDNIPETAELTIVGVNGVGSISAYTGTKRLIIGRVSTENHITEVYFSDDSTHTNQIGAFTEYASIVVADSKNYTVWVSNQDLTQPTDITVTVA